MSPKSGIRRLKGITIVVILSGILLVFAPAALASQDLNSKPGVFSDPATGRLVDIVTPDPKGPRPPDPDSLPEKEMKPPFLGNNETSGSSSNNTQDSNSKPGVFSDPATGRLVDIVTPDPKGPRPPDPDSLPEKGMKNLPSPGNEEAFSLFVVVVYINEPCDEEWRARYGTNWMYWANYAVEVADDYLYQQFGIDYYSVAQNIWYSSSTTSSALLAEADQEVGRTNGADIMVAFTGQTYGSTLGVGYINYGGSLIFDYGSSWNGITVRHETGHNYGLAQWPPSDGSYHCTRSTCLMYPTLSGPTGNTTLCTDHWSEWLNKQLRY